jgi:hypothetical protein
MRQSKDLSARSLELVTRSLREEAAKVTREPFPERWVELIHHLRELEQRRADKPCPHGTAPETATADLDEGNGGTPR